SPTVADLPTRYDPTRLGGRRVFFQQKTAGSAFPRNTDTPINHTAHTMRVHQGRALPPRWAQDTPDPGHTREETKQVWAGEEPEPISITFDARRSMVGGSGPHLVVDRSRRPLPPWMRPTDRSRRPHGRSVGT